MSGKGSKPRPFSISQEEYEKRWDAIFGRDLEDPKVKDEVANEDDAFNHIETLSKLRKD